LTADVHYEAMAIGQTVGAIIFTASGFGRLVCGGTRVRRAGRLGRTGSIVAVVALAAASIACGGGGSSGERMPTAPSTPPPPSLPAANIEFEGNGQLMGCVRTGTTNVRCDFEETAKNIGPGCAARVRITVRLMAGEADVAAESWMIGSRIVRPDEQFVYTVRFTGTPELFTSITGYNRRVEWTNTPC
jgi:hypothetical protein